jgi:hypothetical protein
LLEHVTPVFAQAPEEAQEYPDRRQPARNRLRGLADFRLVLEVRAILVAPAVTSVLPTPWRKRSMSSRSRR